MITKSFKKFEYASNFCLKEQKKLYHLLGKALNESLKRGCDLLYDDEIYFRILPVQVGFMGFSTRHDVLMEAKPKKIPSLRETFRIKLIKKDNSKKVLCKEFSLENLFFNEKAFLLEIKDGCEKLNND